MAPSLDSRLGSNPTPVNATLRHIGRPELDGDTNRRYVGDGAPMLIQARARRKTRRKRLLRQALDCFLAYYRQHKARTTTVYEGIPEVLATLFCAQPIPQPNAPPTNARAAPNVRLSPTSPSTLRPTIGAKPSAWAHFFVSVYGGQQLPHQKSPEPPRSANHPARNRSRARPGPDHRRLLHRHPNRPPTPASGPAGVTYGFATTPSPKSPQTS